VAFCGEPVSRELLPPAGVEHDVINDNNFEFVEIEVKASWGDRSRRIATGGIWCGLGQLSAVELVVWREQ
jgi:hypothetical protein